MRTFSLLLETCVLGMAPAASAVAQTAAPASLGTIVLQLHQLEGSEALDVQGVAPANAPVTITLLAVLSSDIPTVVVSRHDVVTDVTGRFGAIIPIASAYEPGTILRIVATSLPGVLPASEQWIKNAPNSGVNVPFEQRPQRTQ